jgi:hypothetical protein
VEVGVGGGLVQIDGRIKGVVVPLSRRCPLTVVDIGGGLVQLDGDLERIWGANVFEGVCSCSYL